MAELAKIDFEPLVRSAEHIQAENGEAALYNGPKDSDQY